MYLRLINREIKASRWPWQPGYNWHGMTNSTAPLNQPLPGEKAAPRFGGGWKYELGINIGGSTVNLNLLFGVVSISRPRKCESCSRPILRGEKSAPWLEGGYNQHLDCWRASIPEPEPRATLAPNPSKECPF